MRLLSVLVWLAIATTGASAYGLLAFHRGEPLSAAWILVAAVCTYTIAYRFYSKWLATKLFLLDDRRSTPSRVQEDGKDYVKTHKWIVFGHHFAAISGPGPLVGPVLAAQFGYLPGLLWILIGVVLGGAVQDFFILFASLRREGKSLGEMVREEIGNTAGFIALVAILCIMVILIAVLGLVVVKALAGSPWGAFTIAATLPIAFLMGIYLRFLRPHRVFEASLMGVLLLLLSVWAGEQVHANAVWSAWFNFKPTTLAWAIIGYGLLASSLPVWLLLAPRDYLSTFMKLGTIALLGFGIVIVLPDLQLPPLTRFVDGTGPVFAGKVFPFCFITIACGAISGFHSLISSGTTPKLLLREGHARAVGYGSMLLESGVAIMALVAACTLQPGVYFAVNSPAALIGATPDAAVATLTGWGFPITVSEMQELARQTGETSLFGRAGGAPTLALGMAKIFSALLGGPGFMGLWYHFAIMFEALFILTTVDAGTRVGRFLLQAFLGQFNRNLGDTRNTAANLLSSTLLVTAWGYFLYQGVIDPLGGINSLWPLFGIANQLLALVALCLCTTLLIKMGKARYLWVTLIPLLWLGAVTFTASAQKIFHSNPKIGFLAGARQAEMLFTKTNLDPLTSAQILTAHRTAFNLRLDALVAAFFLLLVAAILLTSLWQWFGLLRGLLPRDLHESAPVWLSAAEMQEPGHRGIMRRVFFGVFVFYSVLRALVNGPHQPRLPSLVSPNPVSDNNALAVVSQGSEVELNAQSSGEAWAHQEETRFRNPRCC